MNSSLTHTIGGSNYGSMTSGTFFNQGKSKIISLMDKNDDNWCGKIYHQFQMHGIQFFSELKLNKYSSDYRDIMNCLCKFRREDNYLKNECESLRDTDFEYKQDEIDDSKELWDTIESTFSIISDEAYFVMYIPSENIMMYRVGKKCNFFTMNREILCKDALECKILLSSVVKQHISDTEIKCDIDGKQYIPVIGFYIR